MEQIFYKDTCLQSKNPSIDPATRQIIQSWLPLVSYEKIIEVETLSGNKYLKVSYSTGDGMLHDICILNVHRSESLKTVKDIV